jgi:dTDP-4-amino-4,6-dideoxygalactose transaminase
MKVPFVNLGAQFEFLEQELVETFCRVGRSGAYILGDEVERFETGLAALCGTRYAITVANGTDALILIMKALGIGGSDEVITVPNSFVASAGGIAAVGAKPVFVDVGEDFNLDPKQLEQAITSSTKAIVPVHLTGNPADIYEINKIANKYGILVLEDAAQAIGARHHGKCVGSLGFAAAFSLHPLKNFHLMGDAGFITTDDECLKNKLLQVRNHGLINRNESVCWGLNSRLDSLQAAIGNAKLKHFDAWTSRFKEIAQLYTFALKDVVRIPLIPTENEAVFHNFVIRDSNRDELAEYLLQRGVETKIHYPIPLHLMECSKGLNYKFGDFPATENQSREILSLPIYPELTNEQVKYVCHTIKNFKCAKC